MTLVLALTAFNIAIALAIIAVSLIRYFTAIKTIKRLEEQIRKELVQKTIARQEARTVAHTIDAGSLSVDIGFTRDDCKQFVRLLDAGRSVIGYITFLTYHESHPDPRLHLKEEYVGRVVFIELAVAPEIRDTIYLVGEELLDDDYLITKCPIQVLDGTGHGELTVAGIKLQWYAVATLNTATGKWTSVHFDLTPTSVDESPVETGA
ncbi:hypothetical protein M1555_01950 [Patescibacteria group bacterium]|nr:hypothetical protein [Patescibacteria group bacterium]